MASNAELIRVQRECSNQNLGADRLWEIAQQYPEMQAFVALHPGAPPDLLDWLRENSTPAIQKAVAERQALGAAWQPEPPRIFGIPISPGGWFGRSKRD